MICLRNWYGWGIEMSTIYPEGWGEDRVKRVLKQCEEQNEFGAVAEDEASFESDDQAFSQVPKKLLPKIRKLISLG